MPNRTIAKTVLPNKIAPPKPELFFDRPPLMQKLTELSVVARKIWVSSPGGSGKTTLIRAFLATDTRPLVWYQVDVEDQDPANLFFYLSQTVPVDENESKLLPQLTPEYLPNLPIFCRNFFRAYFARFPLGCVLVFDDLQEGPGESFFGPVLAAAMAELPVNSALFVLSREEPYPSLARDRLNRSLAHLGWDDLRLSTEETRRFLLWSQDKEPSTRETDRAYSLTQGWLAGLLLFLKRPAVEPLPQHFSFDRTELLFDYFAGEIFVQFPAEVQTFLLGCAFLPSIDTSMAESLTGKQNSGEILRGLTRGNHFTFRISAAPEVFRFHPLFRQFLLARAAQEMDAQLLVEIRVQAARLLRAAGQVEAAAELLIAAHAWPGLIELVAEQAEALLRQGRTRTLLAWLRALPDELLHANPWLCYWHGCCLNAENPAEAREELTRAFKLFETTGDAVGSMLTWAMMVYAIVVSWNEHSELDAWVERFYELRKRFPEYPSSEIEALMVQAICQALLWRQPSHPDLTAWATRLHQLVSASNNKTFRILAGADLVLYHTVVGELASARALADLLGSDLHADEVTPVQKLVWLAAKAFSESVALDCPECLATIEAGRTIIAESGVHVLDMRLFSPGIGLGLNTGDLALVRQLRDELKTVPVVTAVDQSFFCLFAADLSYLEGNSAKATVLAEMAVGKAETAGTPIALALSLAELVVVLHQSGQKEKAKEQLAQGLAVSRGMNFFSCYFNLLAAYFAFENEEPDAARLLLRESLGLASRQGYLNFHPWREEIMARLCREALSAGIELDYVKHLASFRKLDLGQSDPYLTPKEIEILNWVREGKTNWEIAQIQGVSERTVKFHVRNILQKLGANSRAHAVSIALELGLVSTG